MTDETKDITENKKPDEAGSEVKPEAPKEDPVQAGKVIASLPSGSSEPKVVSQPAGTAQNSGYVKYLLWAAAAVLALVILHMQFHLF